MTPLRVAQAMTGTGGSGLTVPVQRGGTGKTSWVANRIPYLSSATAFAQVVFPSVAGSVLAQGTSGAPYFRNDIATAVDVMQNMQRDDGIDVVVNFKVIAGRYNGVTATTTGNSAGVRLVGDFAEFSVSLTNLPTYGFIVIPSESQNFQGGGSSSGGGTFAKHELSVNGTYYLLETQEQTSTRQYLNAINWVLKTRKVIPKTSTLKYKITCTVAGQNSWTTSIGDAKNFNMKYFEKQNMV